MCVFSCLLTPNMFYNELINQIEIDNVNEYLKKLNALVQERIERERKKK